MTLHYIIIGLCFLFAGGFDGMQDGLAFHNKSNHPFFGQNSWVNKYKNHDPLDGMTFIGKYFTFLTDGFHLAKLCNHLFLFTGISLSLYFIPCDLSFLIYAGIAAGAWLLNRCGFSLIWRLF